VAQLDEPALGARAQREARFVFQSFNLLARTSAIENVALPLFYAASGPAGAASRTKRARAALKTVAWPSAKRQHAGPAFGRPSSSACARARLDQRTEPAARR